MKFTLKTTLLTAALSTALIGASAFAVAQTTEQGPTAEKRAEHMEQKAATKGNSQGKHRADRMARMQKQQAKHQAELKTSLKLTAEQEAAWSAFVARTAHEPRQADKSGGKRMDWSKLTTPERLDKMEARHAERSERMAKRIEATRSFYAVLTVDQQKTFDAQSPSHFRHAGMKGQHGKGMHKAMHKGMGKDMNHSH